MNPKELSYPALKEIDKTTFIKLFKKPAVWKKASGVIFIAKHRFSNGKLPLVALPFRKYTEANRVYKEEVKKELEAKHICLASLEYVKQEDGNLAMQVTPVKGNLGKEYLETTGKDLVSKLKMDFTVTGANPVVENEDTQDIEDANAALAAQRLEAIKKLNDKVSRLEKQIGKMKAKELVAILKEDQAELEQYEAEANADQNISEEEAQVIAILQQKIENFKDKLQNLLSPEKKQKAIANAVAMAENVDKMLEKVHRAIDKISN